MLLSMTGHGAGKAESPHATVQAEVRAVNNRHLKVLLGGEWSAGLQARVEQTVRDRIQRGTVHVRLAVQWREGHSPYRIDLDTLEAYRRQLAGIVEMGEHIPLQALLGLPGVTGHTAIADDDPLEDTAAAAVASALDRLDEMRQREGSAMRDSLVALLDRLCELREEISRLAPQVAEQYSQRLTERLNQLLARHEIQVQPTDVIREVGMFAERADIHEEIVRLGSHFQQVRAAFDASGSSGRKLDFLTQELLREVNTIGSKANDSRIASCVVEMKTLIDRMRELVQNVE